MKIVFAGVLLGCFVILMGPDRFSVCGGEKPLAPRKDYELRIVTFGDAYKGIRFKPATGQSWQLLAGRWEALEELARPPAGDYEITLIPAESLVAIRLDRKSGATWLVKDGKWHPIKEPPPPKPNVNTPERSPGYGLRHVRLGNQLHLVRFHTTTGDTWHINRGVYELLGEAEFVPAGNFDLTLVAGKKNWMGFRIERKTGMTWLLRDNTWHPTNEPE